MHTHENMVFLLTKFSRKIFHVIQNILRCLNLHIESFAVELILQIELAAALEYLSAFDAMILHFDLLMEI